MITEDLSKRSSEEKQDYWQDYYSKRRSLPLPLPSQFSVFVAAELQQAHRVFDIGCGGGRDSLLFASHGHQVTGVDGSQAAVDACSEAAAKAGVKASFVCASITEPGLGARLESQPELPALVYARFFLHAITEAEEHKFFQLAGELTAAGGLVGIEFRTMRDAEQEKVTATHYRRFIDPLLLMTRAANAGFVAQYFVEGFGFAKYKKDDAHVARFLFERHRDNGR